MIIRRSVIALVLILSAPMLSGCAALVLAGAAGAAGAGTVAYIKGELQTSKEVTLVRAYNAASAAMRDMEFAIIEQDKDAVNAKVVAIGVDKKKIRINMKRVSDHLTQIKIRIGILGNESLSRLILERMQKYF
ncbi:MAG: DUF3568 family protein [Candidatus Dadabacteria bacterium]|nr:DUF3568 family protein [Candidatus Dadabacteria bacterium]